MRELTNAINWLGAVAGSVLAYLFGGWGGLIVALVAMVVIDYITGLIAGCMKHQLSSKTGFRGILKKVLFFIVVAVAHIIDGLIGLAGVLETATLGFLIANEALSILENAGEMGVPIPQKLLDALAQLKNK